LLCCIVNYFPNGFRHGLVQILEFFLFLNALGNQGLGDSARLFTVLLGPLSQLLALCLVVCSLSVCRGFLGEDVLNRKHFVEKLKLLLSPLLVVIIDLLAVVLQGQNKRLTSVMCWNL
jgi:hypothetical protein